ncbi:MAG: sugar ABC transporter permease, partial [Deinococcus sp.]|nr:sugar ABC transporter permease [Deinococcus sp.]
MSAQRQLEVIAAVSPATPRRRRMSALARREAIAAYLFLLPNAAGFLIFTFLAVLAALGLSFTDWDILSPMKWVGLENYRQLFHDTIFHKVLANTILYVLGTVPVRMALALAAALALNRPLRGVLVYRTAFFMPVVSSTVAVALVWRWLYHNDFGLINDLLYRLGVEHPPRWLLSTTWALPALIIMSIWQGLGFSMVLFLAGLQSIPQQLHEAAEIDGAGRWAQFRHITLPMLSPTTFFVLVINVINSFQVFDQALVMTGGGP